MAATATQSPVVPVGAIKSFGDRGALYEVLGSAARGPKGEMVSIRVVPGGETLDYPLNDLLADPLVP